MARALSMSSSGVTQTGQPGPWIISIPAGSIWSIPFLMMEWVWPPQTSMIFQGRVAMEWISRARAWAISRLRNSVRYFIGESASRHPSGVIGVGIFVFLGPQMRGTPPHGQGPVRGDPETGGTHGDSGVSGVRRRGLATAVGARR